MSMVDWTEARPDLSQGETKSETLKEVKFWGAFKNQEEIVQTITKNPLGDYFVVQGDPKRINVSMPVFIEGKPLIEA